MRSSIFLTFLFIIGCATGIDERKTELLGNGDFVVTRHFSKGSDLEADEIARNRCSNQNALPKLIYHQKGCMFGCFNEYHRYDYQCVSNKSIEEDRKSFDSKSCLEWGFSKGTENYANCMLRMYEVRIAVENASTTNQQIRNLSEQQRRIAEQEEAYQLLNLSTQIQQQSRPQAIAPFKCIRTGSVLSCQ